MSGGYDQIITKELRPRIESLRDDINRRRDSDWFPASGTQVYCGRQGSGKTISAVKHVLDWKERYPKAILVSNLELTGYRRIQCADSNRGVLYQMQSFDPSKEYLFFQSAEELARVLQYVNNDFKGVIYLIDEIHTYFNALESTNMPPFIFTEISQQRKQRKVIIGTSQLFMRMAKPFREQCDSLIMCNTLLGFWTRQRAFDGMTLTQDYDGSLHGDVKKSGWFYHSRKLRDSFDTYQKIKSGNVELEEISAPLKLTATRRGKQIAIG